MYVKDDEYDESAEVYSTDVGRGFDWQPYIDFTAERAMDNHGRGIVMAVQMSFDSIEYHGTGSEVVALKKL